MNADEWCDCSKAAPPADGHIVTGRYRPDGTWSITGIHPPGSGRDANIAGIYWARLPEWIIKGPPAPNPRPTA